MVLLLEYNIFVLFPPLVHTFSVGFFYAKREFALKRENLISKHKLFWHLIANNPLNKLLQDK